MLIDGIDASYVDLDDPTFLDFGYVRRIGDVIDVAWPERTADRGSAPGRRRRDAAALHPGHPPAFPADRLRDQRRRPHAGPLAPGPAVGRRARGASARRPARPARHRRRKPGPRRRRRLRGHSGAGDAGQRRGGPARSRGCCDRDGLYVLNVIDSPAADLREGSGQHLEAGRSPNSRRSPTRACCAGGVPATSSSSPASRQLPAGRAGRAGAPGAGAGAGDGHPGLRAVRRPGAPALADALAGSCRWRRCRSSADSAAKTASCQPRPVSRWLPSSDGSGADPSSTNPSATAAARPGPMSPSGASSRSTITGAWSLGSLPLRAARSV